LSLSPKMAAHSRPNRHPHDDHEQEVAACNRREQGAWPTGISLNKNKYFKFNKYGPFFGPGIRTKKRTRPEKTGPYVFSGCVRFRARNVGAVLGPPTSTSERLKRCSLSSPSWWRRCFCCGSCWCWSWWWLWWW
jgi:hypothetical protein